MKTIFEPSTREELIGRIKSLNQESKAQWGKMNVFQMAKHCTIWNEWILGIDNQKYKQGFLGKIFGKMALRNSTKNDKPLDKNVPAGRFTVDEKTGDLELQKQKLIARISEYEHYSNPDFVHDFFGKMTKEQIGIFVYKHFDHHLRQFNV